MKNSETVELYHLPVPLRTEVRVMEDRRQRCNREKVKSKPAIGDVTQILQCNFMGNDTFHIIFLLKEPRRDNK